MANKEGKKFEEDFNKSVPENWTFIRLKDAGGWSNGSNTRFTIHNVCDFLLFTGRVLFLLEMKSHLGVSIPRSNFRQLEDMKKYVNKKNCQQYFILNFRDYSETYLMNLTDIEKCFQSRKSIPLSLCREKGVKLPQTLKRVRYRYDLSTFNNL